MNFGKKILILAMMLIMSASCVFAKTINTAVVSDIHLKPSDDPYVFTESEKNLIFAVESINKNKDIDFTVFLGDNIDKSTPESLESFMNIVKNLKKPYYMVFGNHDAYHAGGIDKDDFIKEVCKYSKYQDKKETSFYFKAGKKAYGLVADGSSYVVPGRHGRYLPELLKEIERLFKHKKTSIILIYQHFPLVDPNDNPSHTTLDKENYLKLISKYKNIVYIATGHFHHEKVTVDENGIYHISVPALGSRAGTEGSGKYQIIKTDYNPRFLKKPDNVKVEVIDVFI